MDIHDVDLSSSLGFASAINADLDWGQSYHLSWGMYTNAYGICSARVILPSLARLIHGRLDHAILLQCCICTYLSIGPQC